MLEQRKLMAYIALFAVGFMLWNAWQTEKNKNTQLRIQTPSKVSSGLVPTVTPVSVQHSQDPSTGNQGLLSQVSDVPSSRLVSIENDLVRLVVDRKGGVFVKAFLKQYPKRLHDDEPMEILDNTPSQLYVAQNGLTGQDGPDRSGQPVMYQVSQSQFQMDPKSESLQVNFRYEDPQGRVFSKIITMKRGRYAIQVTNRVDNRSGQTWQGHLYALIARKKVDSSNGFLHVPSYNGGSIWTPDKPYEKVNYEQMEKDPIAMTVTGGWLAMQQRYFLSTWVADPKQETHYYSTQIAPNVFALGMVGSQWSVAPGKSAEKSLTFYVGPEESKRLEALAPGLKLTIDYGFLWMISVAIFWVMQHIHMVVGNWGWSIVLVTLLIKLLFYYPSATSYRSMAKMRLLQPKIEALKKRFGDDKQKMGQATLELYRSEKANPLGGCLPMLIQFPFFIALYWVLIESVQLRQAPFILWIHDLAVRDPYYILPVLMALSMFVQQKMQPPPPDPTQARMMMFLPVVFGGLFATFPSGLVLYWLTNNILSALQQWWVMSRFEAKRK